MADSLHICIIKQSEPTPFLLPAKESQNGEQPSFPSCNKAGNSTTLVDFSFHH